MHCKTSYFVLLAWLFGLQDQVPHAVKAPARPCQLYTDSPREVVWPHIGRTQVCCADRTTGGQQGLSRPMRAKQAGQLTQGSLALSSSAAASSRSTLRYSIPTLTVSKESQHGQSLITLNTCAASAQLCLQNNGRSAAAALVELVRAACEAYAAGISLERLVLELEHGGHIDHQVQSPGYWLTAADRSYRNQWLKTVRAVY